MQINFQIFVKLSRKIQLDWKMHRQIKLPNSILNILVRPISLDIRDIECGERNTL